MTDTHQPSPLGKRLRKRRRALGLTQEQLAERSGIHQTTISFIEMGRQLPKVDTIDKLALALDDTRLDYLIRGTGRP